MYQKILYMTAVVVALFMGTALAAPRAMTVDDVAIAGIAPGNDLSYVRSIYGEPDGEKTRLYSKTSGKVIFRTEQAYLIPIFLQPSRSLRHSLQRYENLLPCASPLESPR